MKGLLHKYHIPQSGTTETLLVITLEIILQTQVSILICPMRTPQDTTEVLLQLNIRSTELNNLFR
jgi:hypothetical protein